MTATITYKGNTLATADNNTKTLLTSGKYLEDDITITDVTSGGSSWTKIGNTTELTLSYSSTTAASATTIALGSAYYTKDKIIYVRIRDKSGKQAGYFYGSDAYFMNYYNASGATTTLAAPAVVCYRYTTSNALAGTSGQYGLYGYSISSSGTLTIRKRYNSSYTLTIDSTYTIDVYAIDPPAALF